VDTFNNYFHPETSRAALEVLEGRRVSRNNFTATFCVRASALRFWNARRSQEISGAYLASTWSADRSWIARHPFEPSCASVFRDELVNLFPDDALAKNCALKHFSSANSCKTALLAINPISFRAAFSFTAIVIIKR
jgi:hypothetical protein